MPAAPTAEMSPGALIENLRAGEPVVEGTVRDNRANAARELEMIEELLASRAFQWFETEFIDKPYAASFEALRSKFTKPEDLASVQQTYVALREIKSGCAERELAHRELISPTDPVIAVLRSKLAAL